MRASRCRVDFFDRDHRRRFAANIRGGVSSSSSSVVGFGSIGSVTTTALFSGAVQPAPREEPVEHDDDDDSCCSFCALFFCPIQKDFIYCTGVFGYWFFLKFFVYIRSRKSAIRDTHNTERRRSKVCTLWETPWLFDIYFFFGGGSKEDSTLPWLLIFWDSPLIIITQSKRDDDSLFLVHFSSHYHILCVCHLVVFCWWGKKRDEKKKGKEEEEEEEEKWTFFYLSILQRV